MRTLNVLSSTAIVLVVVLVCIQACNAPTVPIVGHCYREYYPVYASKYKVVKLRTYGFQGIDMSNGRTVWIPLTVYETLREVGCK